MNIQDVKVCVFLCVWSFSIRGIFYQGYRCTRCKMAAHKECLGRVPPCGRNAGLILFSHLRGRLTRIQVQSYLSCFFFSFRKLCDYKKGQSLPTPSPQWFSINLFYTCVHSDRQTHCSAAWDFTSILYVKKCGSF